MNETNSDTRTEPTNSARGGSQNIVKDINETALKRLENKMSVALRESPIVVSERQFESVATEHKISLDLLNCSGNVLLSAMASMIPPEGSSRVVGEYSADGIRAIAKSICDVMHTKSSVIRSMYSIARDER